jgi:hypothetical protein
MDVSSLQQLSDPAPTGHLRVCGVELRMRAGVTAATAPPPPLVMTSTVRRNLKSLALALCGVRSLLRLGCCAAAARARLGCERPGILNTQGNAS